MKVRIARTPFSPHEGPPLEARASTPLREAPAGLAELDEAPLSDAARQKLERALSGLRGDPAWRTRKSMELRDLFALEERAERLEVIEVDARTELVVKVRLFVPVPVMRMADVRKARTERRASEESPESHRVRNGAVVGVRYPPEILRAPLAGYGSVTVEEPREVWHPNVSFDRKGRVCLGTSIRRGTPLREIVLQVYAALALQALTLEHGDPAGVMNAGAVRYWRKHRDQLPLTRASLLDPLGESTDGRASKGGQKA